MTPDIAINWSIYYYIAAGGFLMGFSAAALFMIVYVKQNREKSQ